MTFKPIYTPQFKQFIRDNPGLIRKFAQAYQGGAEKYENSGVKINRFNSGMSLMPAGTMVKNGQVHHKLWTVEAGGRKLFVKETLRENEWEDFHFTGRRQYKATLRLSGFARLLSKFWKHDLETLEPQFAATYCDTSFIVMEYMPFRQASESILPEKLKKRMWAFQRLAELFAGIFDVTECNAFYDEKRGKLVLYDPGRSLHSFPIRAAIYAWRAIRKLYRELKRLLKSLEFPVDCIAPAVGKERLLAEKQDRKRAEK